MSVSHRCRLFIYRFFQKLNAQWGFRKTPTKPFLLRNVDLSEQRKAKKYRKAKQLFREKGVRVLTKSHTKSNQEKATPFLFRISRKCAARANDSQRNHLPTHVVPPLTPVPRHHARHEVRLTLPFSRPIHTHPFSSRAYRAPRVSRRSRRATPFSGARVLGNRERS